MGRAKATIIEVSHAVYISQPQAGADAIDAAARYKKASLRPLDVRHIAP